MLKGFVECAVPNPGAVTVGSTITLGAAPTGFNSFLTAFGAAAPAYFQLSDGAGRTIEGIWTVNAGSPETATITEIIWNYRLGSTAGETFSTACTAWSAKPAKETMLVRSGPFAGLRNLIINGNPLINQRGYVSGTATVAANQYTLDRWRVVTSGQAVSWTDSAGIRTVTAPAGGMEQVIEGLGLIGGTYTVNWVGTASCTVGGASVAKGAQVTLTGGVDVTIRLTGGTWSQLQIEPGPIATPYERRPIGLELWLCQRYWTRDYHIITATTAGNAWAVHYLPNAMRATPTLTFQVIADINTTSNTVAPVGNTRSAQVYAAFVGGGYHEKLITANAEF